MKSLRTFHAAVVHAKNDYGVDNQMLANITSASSSRRAKKHTCKRCWHRVFPNKHKEIIKTTGNAKRFELHMQPNVVGDAHCSTESSCLLEKMHSLFPKKQQL